MIFLSLKDLVRTPDFDGPTPGPPRPIRGRRRPLRPVVVPACRGKLTVDDLEQALKHTSVCRATKRWDSNATLPNKAQRLRDGTPVRDSRAQPRKTSVRLRWTAQGQRTYRRKVGHLARSSVSPVRTVQQRTPSQPSPAERLGLGTPAHAQVAKIPRIFPPMAAIQPPKSTHCVFA